MILSVSRRTDIPALYPEWFMNRIREGYVITRNPMNYHAVSRISLSPDILDCIVFWSKNPVPILRYLDEINELCPFYFQFTLNAFERDLEPNLPGLNERIDAFKYLSEKYGKEHVIWRYDPVVISDDYDISWHLHSFRKIADCLARYTDNCVFSFVDVYDKVRINLKGFNIIPFSPDSMNQIAEGFAEIAHNRSLILKTCAEAVDLAKYGIDHSCCIDPERISKLLKCDLLVRKDRNQRAGCECVESVDIGQYNTCRNGCKYCYANFSPKSAQSNFAAHSPDSPLLTGKIEQADKITERKVFSIKQTQISLF